jgi:negative regulator of sigma E activity
MNQDFEKRTRELLEQSTARLDGRTLSRLTQARHAALAQREQPARAWWRTWMPAGAAAAAAVLAVMVWTRPGIEPRVQVANAGNAFEDMDLIVDAPDFVGDAEDVEFYEWASGEIES